MEQRTRDILKLLLQENSFQTTADIGARLSVSSKTVSRQLPKVEETLNSVGLQLEKKSGAGIKVVGSEVKRYALAKQLKSGEKREYTPNERRSIIISKLLSSHEPIKLFVLSSAVHVTDSTISNDLDKLETWFREQGLKLLRKPGLGVSLLGDERDFRRAIVRYIYEHVGEERLLNLMQDNLPEGGDEPIAQVSKFLLELIDAGEWRQLEQMIRVMENDLGYKLSDNAFIGLAIHLSLTMRRVKNHEAVKLDEENFQRLRSSREFSAAEKLAEKLSVAFEVDVPESEICYIAMHILGARSRYSSASLGTISMMDNYRIVKLARQVMKNAAKVTGRDIDKNQNLLAGLGNHLAPSISRLKMRMDIRNRGSEGNGVVEQSVEPAPLRTTHPEWMPDGMTVESVSGNMVLELQCRGDGELEVGLLGRDERDASGRRYPVWIDCTYFSVNGEAVFEGTQTVCHDRRYRYRRAVRDGEVVRLEVSWGECRSPSVLEEWRRLEGELRESRSDLAESQRKLGDAEQDNVFLTDRIQDETQKNQQLTADILSIRQDLGEERNKNRKLSSDLVGMTEKFKEKHADSENQKKYIAHVATQLQRFRLEEYLKYKVLSKLTFGQLRARYKEKYQEQERIYESIKMGNFKS